MKQQCNLHNLLKFYWYSSSMCSVSDMIYAVVFLDHMRFYDFVISFFVLYVY